VKISASVSDDGVALVEVRGRVDAVTSPEVGKVLFGLLDQGHHRIILDFSDVDYISSAGLRILTQAQQAAHKHKGGVRLFGLSEIVRHVFELAGLDAVLKIVNTREEAVKSW
jgi:anti-anti-sigma factor